MLNGASSSRKSTPAHGLQTVLADPFLHLTSDQLVVGGAIPNRRNESASFGWPGTMRTRFFDGFHRCIPAMAAAGHNLVVDHIIEYPEWRDQLRQLLEGIYVFLVGVHCDLDELHRHRSLARALRALVRGVARAVARRGTGPGPGQMRPSFDREPMCPPPVTAGSGCGASPCRW